MQPDKPHIDRPIILLDHFPEDVNGNEHACSECGTKRKIVPGMIEEALTVGQFLSNDLARKCGVDPKQVALICQQCASKYHIPTNEEVFKRILNRASAHEHNNQGATRCACASCVEIRSYDLRVADHLRKPSINVGAQSIVIDFKPGDWINRVTIDKSICYDHDILSTMFEQAIAQAVMRGIMMMYSLWIVAKDSKKQRLISSCIQEVLQNYQTPLSAIPERKVMP